MHFWMNLSFNSVSLSCDGSQIKPRLTVWLDTSRGKCILYFSWTSLWSDLGSFQSSDTVEYLELNPMTVNTKNIINNPEWSFNSRRVLMVPVSYLYDLLCGFFLSQVCWPHNTNCVFLEPLSSCRTRKRGLCATKTSIIVPFCCQVFFEWDQLNKCHMVQIMS